MTKSGILILFLLALTFACSNYPNQEIISNTNAMLADYNNNYSGIKVVYYENGQKMAEESYKDGKLHGEKVVYSKDGERKAEERYNSGEKDDVYTGWYKDGKKKMEGKYKEGKREGKWTWWDEKGEVSYELCYGGC